MNEALPEIEFDDGPGRHRIGLIALANDRVIERDLMTMCPPSDVLLYTNRISFDEDCTLESLRAMGPRITDAASLLLPGLPLDAIIYGCTSGTAAIGPENVAASIHAVRPDAVCITPLTAALAAFDALGAGSIAVMTPYIDAVAAPILDAVAAHGIEIAGATNLQISVSAQISATTPASIRAHARAADRDDADLLFLSCTDLRALETIADLEKELGKPVVTSNQAIFWHALRSCGCDAVPEGYGRLWTHMPRAAA